MRYLVRMTPLEPYSFGTERNFAYPGEEQMKATYFVDSACVPEQTTVLGMLRYEVLKQSGDFTLKPRGGYTPEEKEQMGKLVGCSNLDFESLSNSFGVILGISPVFLMEGEEIMIRTPFNHLNVKDCPSDSYRPMVMNAKAVTSAGIVTDFPGRIKPEGGDGEIWQYDAKMGYESGYMRISDKTIIREGIFKKTVRTRNWISGKQDEDNDLFKTEVVELKPGYSFGVYVDTEGFEFRESSLVHMGRNGSLFMAEFIGKSEGRTFDEKVGAAFCSVEDDWYYALSDLCLKDTEYENFCIVEEKQLRGLDNDGKRRAERKNVVSGGSVFYKCSPHLDGNESLLRAGYNHLIRIGRKTEEK